MVTLNDISKASGFSPATISRLFKNDPTLSIKPKTKRIIYDTAIELGYPMEKIRFAFDNVLFLYWISETDEHQDDYFRELYKQIMKFAKNKNLTLTVLRKGVLDASVLANYEAFIAVGSFSMGDLEMLETYFDYGVYVESQHFQNKFDSVNPDLAFITKKAIRLFLDKGYRQIGFVGDAYFSPDLLVESRDVREVNFRNYLHSYSLLNEKFIFSGGKFSRENGQVLARRMLAGDELPQALLVASDTIALGVLDVLEAEGVSGIDIISINNIVSPLHQSQTLSSFTIDIEEMSRTAIGLLYEQLTQRRSVSKNVSIGSHLYERATFILNKI
ncbi:substrate-binding domain-containing protein [Fundicoccus culcitae]|uniref:Substrate-binding domain-containing protein n=1 Tax=Fundicoccus culcitae TaxID=2969821 RepID=A0ABY5P939_9LACT|nr:substrate-binding domain-containing protein [Fundicoccus culcitae]UUX35110.1 substrate-binding domain-containing protein [Fundicoccus culcitae]